VQQLTDILAGRALGGEGLEDASGKGKNGA
jgi:hypothetical protein